ncbi:MAG TPA: SDR family oxidoreductase [Candidatus Hydrogenedentes bacterium]|nr:SDR family oxidoreductase [Candidatus Hydrogenedentota bacterium]
MTKEKAIRSALITGASTGIGEACAMRLAARGWRVFAGVRREEDGRSLAAQASGSIVPVRLDVTNKEHIAAAVKQVRGLVGEDGLDGLLNNAGIAVGGPLEYLPEDQVEYQFRVNVFGAIAVTQAFLPLIRLATGRILFTSSNSGFWCEPFLSVYGGSKHALEAIGDSLRFELQPWGIHVALIEPGMVRTPIWDKAKNASDNADALYPPEALERYAAPIAAMRRIIEEKPSVVAPPERVARAVQHALEARRPKTRYQVGLDCRIQYCLRRVMPDRMRDRLARLIMGL